jgi:NADH dehydrogenase (ubiquinone) Fe-S protein 3
MNSNNLTFINYIVSNLNKYLKSIIFNKYKNNVNLYLTNYKDLKKIIIFFKKHTLTQYYVMYDLFGIDLLDKKKRFQIVYGLLSIRYNSRLRINIFVKEEDKIDSLINIFQSSNWLEREVWDLFGIFFSNHLNLRRILTDYGFEGFALRKDFPLSGFIELRYDDSLKRIVYESIETMQEFRFFDFRSPWDQIENLY